MKRFFISLSVLITLAVQAQVKWSLQTGIVHTNGIQVETPFFENDPVFGGRTGFVVGANLQIPMGKKWAYEPGLFYMGKTLRYRTSNVFDFSMEGNDQLHYGVLSQNLLLRLWAKHHTQVSIGAGLYGAVAMGGSYTRNLILFGGTGSESGSLPIGTTQSDRYRRFDVGGNLLLRVQYRQWQITAQFSPSITDYDRDGEIRLKSLALMLGYEF